mmetsp:Transcript_4027/g.17075  ORF Transcript_4027/g.17075 Transcript_4027/m.17075 type:complete len:221 (+) Transcript_4027:23-685(+)
MAFSFQSVSRRAPRRADSPHHPSHASPLDHVRAQVDGHRLPLQVDALARLPGSVHQTRSERGTVFIIILFTRRVREPIRILHQPQEPLVVLREPSGGIREHEHVISALVFFPGTFFFPEQAQHERRDDIHRARRVQHVAREDDVDPVVAELVAVGREPIEKRRRDDADVIVVLVVFRARINRAFFSFKRQDFGKRDPVQPRRVFPENRVVRTSALRRNDG